MLAEQMRELACLNMDSQYVDGHEGHNKIHVNTWKHRTPKHVIDNKFIVVSQAGGVDLDPTISWAWSKVECEGNCGYPQSLFWVPTSDNF